VINYKIERLDFWMDQVSSIISVDMQFLGLDNFKLDILREDQLFPDISGNKFRKLVPNIRRAFVLGLKRIVTFGGAYSNHIAATAAAGRLFNFETIGIIRGHELADKINLNPTLSQAQRDGMKFKFVSRKDYKKRDDSFFVSELMKEFGPCLLVPEGGTNASAIEGVSKMMRQISKNYEIICSSVGTGGTMAGILNGASYGQKVWGFSALKGINHSEFLEVYGQGIDRKIFDQYHFGGYAKTNDDLIKFINKFKAETNIALDPVYTGKMIFGLIDQLRLKPELMSQNILAVHTGGLQGIKAFNSQNKKIGNLIL